MAEPVIDGSDHEVAHVVAGDAGGGANEAHGLAVAAVESEGGTYGRPTRIAASISK